MALSAPRGYALGPRDRSPRVRRRGGGRRDSLRIALLSPVWFPVPPPLYGGIESVVALLAEGLADAGHEVTVFASGDSRVDADVSWVYPQAPSARIGEPLPELRQVLSCSERGRSATTCSPSARAARRQAVIAAIPEPKATAASVPSSWARARSKRPTVGLCSRA